MPPSPLGNSPVSWESPVDGCPDHRRQGGLMTFEPLPSQSARSALILDRFSIHCTIQYCSNNLLVEPVAVMGRSIFDFVAQTSDEQVRQWIDLIKAWGVNERGQPSDGGFGFGRFMLLPGGRDSRSVSHYPVAMKLTHPFRSELTSEMPTKRRRDTLAVLTRRKSQLQAGESREDASTVQEVPVDAIFSAHSDGIVVILRATSLCSNSG